MSDRRPDPDVLLERAREEEARLTRGRLKVFLGAAPGVGKTYAMLEAARELRAAGTGVVVGYAETHGRAETETLLAGLEVVPPRRLEYHGARRPVPRTPGANDRSLSSSTTVRKIRMRVQPWA